LDCQYPLVQRSNTAPFHILHGFIHFLNGELNLKIQPNEFKGDVRVSAEEKAWRSQVEELTGEDMPFWLISAGGKYDVTTEVVGNPGLFLWVMVTKEINEVTSASMSLVTCLAVWT